MPGAGSFRGVASQLARFRATARSWNATITKLERNPHIPDSQIPERVSMSDWNDFKTGKEFNQWIYDHQAILKKNNPTAQTVSADGQLQYNKQQQRRVRQRVQAYDRTNLYRKYPDFDTLSPAERARINAGRYTPDFEEIFAEKPFATFVDIVGDRRRTQIYNYLDTIADLGENWGIYGDEVSYIIEEFMRQNPAALDYIFDLPDPELDNDFLYLSADRTTGIEKASANLTPFEERRNKVVSYWEQKADEFGIDY